MGMKFNFLLLRLPPFLDLNIAKKSFPSYQATATAMGGFASRNIYLGDALGIVLRFDHEQGHPLRSASVVRGPKSKGRGLPGSGFFWVCRELGLVNNLDDHPALIEFWANQVQRLGLPLPAPLSTLRKWTLAFNNLEAVYLDSLGKSPIIHEEAEVAEYSSVEVEL